MFEAAEADTLLWRAGRVSPAARAYANVDNIIAECHICGLRGEDSWNFVDIDLCAEADFLCRSSNDACRIETHDGG